MSDEADPALAIEGLVARIEAIADEAVRADTRELVRGVLAFHRKGLVRVLDVAKRFDGGSRLVDELARDATVAPLLILHDLHPADRAERVTHAIERLVLAYPDLALDRLEGGRLKVKLGARGGAPAASAKVIEMSLLEAVPDLESVEVSVTTEAPLVRIRRKEVAP